MLSVTQTNYPSHLAERIEENLNKPKSEQSVSRPSLNPSTPQIQVRRITDSANLLGETKCCI